MYTWGYIKNVALAKLDYDRSINDLTNDTLITTLITRFPYYANEAMTQICSTCKPNNTFASFDVFSKFALWRKLCWKYKLYESDKIIDIVEPSEDDARYADKLAFYNEWTNAIFVDDILTMPNDFIGFGDDVCYQIIENPCNGNTSHQELFDEDFSYIGYNKVQFNHPGKFYISYKSRWYMFEPNIADDTDLSAIPTDILDCLPSYIASQCYKVDDQVKSQIFRSEFETAMARIDDTNFKNTKTLTIGGDW